MRQMLLAALLLLLGGCGRESEADYVARQLDMDLPEPVSVISGDSHGGFHGDGTSCLILAFTPENGAALAEELAGRTDWQALPLDELPATVMESILSLLAGQGLDYTLPTQGWYWYSDRSPAGHSRDFPLNCTIAIYDPQSCQLAYFVLDT